MSRPVALLAAAALLLPGCFTVAGGVIGSQVTTTDTARMPDGQLVVTESDSVVAGIVIGALLDAATIFAISQIDLSDNCFTYGPGEGKGGC